MKKKILALILSVILSFSNVYATSIVVGISFGGFLKLVTGSLIVAGLYCGGKYALDLVENGAYAPLSDDDLESMQKELSNYSINVDIESIDDLVKLGMGRSSASKLYEAYEMFRSGSTLSECLSGMDNILGELCRVSGIQVTTDFYNSCMIIDSSGSALGMMGTSSLYNNLERRFGMTDTVISEFMTGETIPYSTYASMDMDEYRKNFNMFCTIAKQKGFTKFFCVATNVNFSDATGYNDYICMYPNAYSTLIYYSDTRNYIMPTFTWYATNGDYSIEPKKIEDAGADVKAIEVSFTGEFVHCSSFVSNAKTTITSNYLPIGLYGAGTLTWLCWANDYYGLNGTYKMLELSQIYPNDISMAVPQVATSFPVVDVYADEVPADLTLEDILSLVGSKEVVLDNAVAKDLTQDIVSQPDLTLDNSEIIGAIQAQTDSFLAEPSGAIDLSPLYISLENKFPFCIPFDMYNAISSFNVNKKPFVLIIDLSKTGSEVFAQAEPIQFDFSQFDDFISVFRYMMLFFFVFWLIILTRKIIG